MTDTIRPIVFTWDGDAMVPINPRAADRQYVVHETYRLAPYEERSVNSHNHYFAAVHDGWGNLPEHYAERFPTDEHLRKFALIKAGYHDQRSIVGSSKAEAQRIAAFIRPSDEFAIVTVLQATVTVFTAKSQSLRAMGKAEFQRSKEAVLDIIASLIGVPADTLKQNAGRAA